MKKKYLDIAEKCLVIIGLTFFTGGFSVGSATEQQLIPNFILTLIRYLIWGLTSFLICIRWKSALITASRDKILWILIAIILLSFVWSDFPDNTFKNNREVGQMASFSLYFATCYSLREQVKLVAWTFAIGALLSIFFALTLPSIAIHAVDHPGAWRGIYEYKNTFGSMMLISSLAFFLLPIDNPRHRLYKWGGVSISLAMVLLSTSKTSLVVYFLLILILVFYRNFQWRGRITVFFLDIAVLILGCVGILVISNWVTLLTGLGKNPTLSGRTLIWSGVLFRLDQRPWLGFGRGEFWSHENPYAGEIGKLLGNGLVLPHAHNGFLDFALDVGYIGFSLFLISYFIAFARALKRAYAAKNSEDLWPLAFLLFLAMNNMTESYLLRHATVYWVLYVTIALSVARRKQPSQLKTG